MIPVAGDSGVTVALSAKGSMVSTMHVNSSPDAHDESHVVAIRFDDVSFSYGSVPVLDHARFHIHEGEFAALVGPNGAGKTTVLRLLLGLARPSGGRIAIFGSAPQEARSSIGYVPQHASFDPAFPISVREVVRMGRLVGTMPRSTCAGARAAEAADRKSVV